MSTSTRNDAQASTTEASADGRSGRDVPSAPSLGERVRNALAPQKISGVYVWLLLIVFFSIATEQFLTMGTLRTIASEQAVTALLAMGLTIALAAGAFDLSVGAGMGFAGLVVARLMVDAELSPLLAVVIALLVMGLVGGLNAVIVVKAKVAPIITTLGMGSILTAATFVVSDNQNIIGLPQGFRRIADIQVASFPIPTVYVLVVAMVLWYLLEWTPFGRRLYATGGGEEVARLAGVRTSRYLSISFVSAAVIAGLAGIIVTSRLGTGSPDVGPTYLLPAFAACFLGATQFRPGRFNIWGTLLAVYLLATGVKGLVYMGADFWVPDLFNGVALIVAVALSSLQSSRRNKKLEKAADREAAVAPAAA